MLSEEIKKELVDLLNERVNPSFILLFGSHGKGTAREDSDIDLGYYAVDLLSSYERFILAGELARVAKKEVDLVNIREVDTVFAMQIFSTGKLLSCHDENEFIKQRMKAFSMYINLNQQRADVLQSIRERGSVFGDE
ncbi:nucleotidyltransferase [Sporosarcina sp. P21c]|uniref:type VII toxin-antitoxin system MntA family adenylyltransferase antitoxin n=1 Tax=unclassified Sporosarcina TaxID=2647733 RepID=UPI000C16A2AD|nr:MULTISPECIES: nucleotidyltransferase domain-containing protein [unclassified Sporosarcina]PIC66142.1 nucleotidyltransferase [Sporosarcina sp. P16a]PIC86846.1 nucleotidyltransferase [Sporosarcina sp. P21c]PIC91806.1 nucleotidyltransferase [Sporosarcina sp. P25]